MKKDVKCKKTDNFFAGKNKRLTFAHENQSGRSSVRLEYTSGGRVVAGSNPVTPTDERLGNLMIAEPFSFVGG